MANPLISTFVTAGYVAQLDVSTLAVVNTGTEFKSRVAPELVEVRTAANEVVAVKMARLLETFNPSAFIVVDVIVSAPNIGNPAISRLAFA